MRVLNQNDGGAKYGSQNFVIMINMVVDTELIVLKTYFEWDISRCLEVRVGGNHTYIVSLIPTQNTA